MIQHRSLCVGALVCGFLTLSSASVMGRGKDHCQTLNSTNFKAKPYGTKSQITNRQEAKLAALSLVFGVRFAIQPTRQYKGKAGPKAHIGVQGREGYTGVDLAALKRCN